MEFMTRRFYAGMLCLVAVALAACGLAKPLPNFDSFAHRVTDGTVALYWDCSRPEPGLLRVMGWANNPYYPQPITDLGFNLYGVSAQNSDISSVQASTQAYQIFTNEPSAFTLNLFTVEGEVRFDLVYHYQFGDGRFGMSAGDDQRNLARNACAGLAP
jgi:hypothetical protein